MRDSSTFASRYKLAASADWQALLRLFELNESFAFIVLLVPNEEGAIVCRDALAKHLEENGKEILELETTPGRLREIANALLFTKARLETGAVWVSRVVSEGAADYREWREAWRRGVSALNQHRNPLRRKWSVPVVFVGAPWLQEVLRESAPDLWSVRTQVAWVEPEAPAMDASVPRAADDVPRRGPDPEMAIAEAERLRGKKGSELVVARLLYRAGLGFAASSQRPEATRVLEESLEIRRRSGAGAEDIADSCFQLGVVLSLTSDYSRAIALLKEASGLYRKEGSPLQEAECIRRLGDIELWRSNDGDAQQLFEEARLFYRQVGSLQGEASCIRRLGDIARGRGKHGEAQRRYKDALSLFRRAGWVLGEANCIASLAGIALERADPDEAERQFEEALRLFRQIGSVLGEANCILKLGDIARQRSDFEMANGLYETALHRYEAMPDSYSIGITRRRLAGLAATPEDRARHLQAACTAWLSIHRADLVKELDEEFKPSS